MHKEGNQRKTQRESNYTKVLKVLEWASNFDQLCGEKNVGVLFQSFLITAWVFGDKLQNWSKKNNRNGDETLLLLQNLKLMYTF